MARIRAKSASPAVPLGTIKSIRSIRPTRPNTSCAVEMSVINSPSNDRRLRSSDGASRPTMVMTSVRPPITMGVVSPTERP